MNPFLIAALILTFATVFLAAGFWVGVTFCRRNDSEPIACESFVQVVEPTVELAAAELIAAQAQTIAMLSTVKLEPVSDWSVLPWSAPPSRIEVAVSEALAVEVMRLRGQVAELTELWCESERKRSLHWESRRKAWAKVRELQPKVLFYADFERECELKTAYHEKARSFADRILASQDLLDSGAGRSEIKAALGGNVIQFPQVEEKAKAA